MHVVCVYDDGRERTKCGRHPFQLATEHPNMTQAGIQILSYLPRDSKRPRRLSGDLDLMCSTKARVERALNDVDDDERRMYSVVCSIC